MGDDDFFAGLADDVGVKCCEVIDGRKRTAGVAALGVGDHLQNGTAARFSENLEEADLVFC